MRFRSPTSAGWKVGLLLACGAGALAACSLLVPVDQEQCATDADCAARGAAFQGAACVNRVCVAQSGGDDAGLDVNEPADAGVDAGEDADPWGCLSQPGEVTDPGRTVALTLKIFDALKPITTNGVNGGDDLTVLTDTPVPGVAIEGCDVLDPSCANPTAPKVTTDDAGAATMSLPESFAGFFRLEASGRLPTRLYTGQLRANAPTQEVPAAILATQGTQLLAAAIGVSMSTDPDGGVGHAFFQVYDCFDRHGDGVVFALSFAGDAGANTVQFYTQNKLPSTTATQTDTLGAGGMVNVPVGAATLTATLASSGRTLGSINALIGPGEATFVWIRVRTH